MAAGRVRVGVGGWTYDPWRETFYPKEVKKASELNYASRQLTSIEINGTFYRLQSASTFAKWRDATPEGFVFSVKAHRLTTYRKELAAGGDSVNRFLTSGLMELGDKLGPVLWQIEPRHAFEPDDLSRFLDLLPPEMNGRRLQHVIEVRHPTFACEQFIDMARKKGVSLVFADTDEYPSFADVSGEVVYARLMRAESEIPTGYKPEAIATWATKGKAWAEGGEPEGLPRIAGPAPKEPRDVFLFFISGAKERNPAAAKALIAQIQA